MQVDYLIIGQGICGSFLSHYLQKANKSFVIIDVPKPHTASKVASGVINPITGRRFVRTWMIETIMPFAVEAYKELEKEFNTSLIHQKNIIDFHASPQMRLAFEERLPQETEYLSKIQNDSQFKEHFNYNFGVGEIKPSWLVDVNELLQKTHEKLLKNNQHIEAEFDIEQLILKPNEIKYGHINASKIIFCDGINSASNKYFNLLPFAPNKGEVLLIETNDFPTNNIFKQGLTILPWQKNIFWVGSSYEWSFKDENISQNFLDKTINNLNFWLRTPYKIMDHFAGIRPANVERRPFVGLHPSFSQVGILNGMGAKGCSLAPYFANELVNHLVKDIIIEPSADVRRFSKILQRII